MLSHFQPLLTKLNLTFKNEQLLIQAFTHRSYLNETKEQNLVSNERLEFLGDSILALIISEHLFKTYPTYPEGLLTNLRSTIVRTETLSSISKSLDFGQFLLLSKGEEKGAGRENSSLLADTFEGFLGSLYLDQGLLEVKKFLGEVLLPKIPEIIKSELVADYKSKLQEIVQETSPNPPTYKVVKAEGPDHAKTFWVQVVIDDKPREIGTGKSKQEAEQTSAHLTLEKMGKLV